MADAISGCIFLPLSPFLSPFLSLLPVFYTVAFLVALPVESPAVPEETNGDRERHSKALAFKDLKGGDIESEWVSEWERERERERERQRERERKGEREHSYDTFRGWDSEREREREGERERGREGGGMEGESKWGVDYVPFRNYQNLPTLSCYIPTHTSSPSPYTYAPHCKCTERSSHVELLALFFPMSGTSLEKIFYHGNKHKRILCASISLATAMPFPQRKCKAVSFLLPRLCVRLWQRMFPVQTCNAPVQQLWYSVFFFCQSQKHISKFTGLTLCCTHDMKLCLRIIKSLLSQICNAFPSTRRLILSLIRLLDYISAAIRY